MRSVANQLAFAAVVLLLGGMAASSFRQVGHSSRTEVRERLAAFVAAVDARELAPRERDALWGETVSGSAFAHYAEVSRTLARVAPNFQGWCDGDEKRRVPAQRRAELREAWREALDALGVAVRSRDRSPMASGPPESIVIATVVGAEIEGLLDEGRDAEALTRWRDWAAMHIDMLGTGNSREFGIAQRAFWLWKDERLASLTSEGLSQLSGYLAVVEPYFDVTSDVGAKLASCLRPVLDGAYVKEWTLRNRLWAWQSGFSPDDRHLAGFAELIELASVLEPRAADLPGRMAQLQAFAAPLSQSTYLTCSAAEGLAADEHWVRCALASLRLLRIAVALHAGEPPPELADPLGAGAIVVHEADGRALVRTATGMERFVRLRN